MKKLMNGLMAVLMAHAALAGPAFAQEVDPGHVPVNVTSQQQKEEVASPPSLSKICHGTFCCVWIDEDKSPYCH